MLRRLIVLFLTSALVAGCTKAQKEKFRTLSTADIEKIQAEMRSLPFEPVSKEEVGVIETDFGQIVIEFFTDVAPKHCANFKKLANHGFYDGTTFHRVIPGFVIQGGDILSRDADPTNDGMGSPGYTIEAEFSNRPHKRGVVSMARKPGDPNSAGSQFFICLRDLPGLDRNYSVFGQVIKGMDVVDKIAQVETGERNRPVKPVVMRKVRVVKRSEL